MTETISDARAALTTHVARFREEGIDAEPVIFGDRRRPEAALLPYETFVAMMETMEDLAIAERLREREASDTGERVTLAELADELGIDLDAL